MTVSAEQSDEQSKTQKAMAAILQRMPGFMILLLLLLGFLAPRYTPLTFAAYYIFCNTFLLASTLRTAIGVCFVWFYSYRQHKTNWRNLAETCDTADIRFGEVKHLIVIPNYKENIENLRDTLNVLASHSDAKKSYKICLGMEETELACEEKAKILVSEYKSSFETIEYSVHPAAIPGELRGKSSNVNWASRHMAKSVNTTSEKDAHRYIFTIMDADSCFTNDYFITITATYVMNPDFYSRRLQIFVPFSVFDRNSTNISPFVRQFDVSWSFAQMSYFIPGYYFCPGLSAYSVPFDLAVAADFWATGTDSLGEDTRMTLKLFFASRYRLRMTQIYTPVSQCNIEGSTKSWVSSFYARTVQGKRHNWGGNMNWIYSMRTAISFLFNLSSDTPRLPVSFLTGVPKSNNNGNSKNNNVIAILISCWNACIRWLRYAVVIFHQFEISIWTVHVLAINLLAILFIPHTGPAFLYAFSDAYWSAVNGYSAESNGGNNVDSYLVWIVHITSYIQLAIVPLVVVIAVGFEGLHWWNSVGRWRADEVARRKVEGREDGFGGRVKSLGLRSAVTCKPRQWYNLIEWVLFPLVAIYFVIMLVYVSLMQLFFDRIDYITAAKPSISKTDEGSGSETGGFLLSA
ncbi:hypothetical protein HK100_012241 [Physocladia obscura]|uniref:Glycosyltransferase 2-like domain-containing protein n=1 Tax=Physocladia obscura TaxID=109957 RepID=A0AAD5T2V5_9FUNG|nr:hypothetical protein HK100_012241 [Physocladia obscura]